MTSALPFQLRSAGDGVRLALGDLEAIGNLRVDLELEVPAAADEAALPVAQALERYQRRRTKLGTLEVRVDQAALDRHVAARAAALAAAGFTDVRARIGEGEVSVTARVTDGLTSADVSFLVVAVARGGVVRVLATAARVHGHLPTPGPVLAHRILELGLGAPAAPAADPVAGRGEPTTPAAGRDGVRTAGLCEVELDAVTAILWRLLPAAGWRLPAVTGVAVDGLRAGKGSLVVSYGPATRDELATTGPARQLAIAHEAMRSVDELVRRGQLDEAMRGYRALLAAGGPDQPVLLERILAVAAARPTLFGDGLELARQAMARWPGFPAALAALASIALARGETAEAAARLAALSDGAARAHDGGGAALAALTAARLLRVIDPAATTPLYQRVLAYWPDHAEGGESLAARLAEDGRFADLAAFLERRAGATADPRRAARDWARAAVLRAEILGERGPAAAANRPARWRWSPTPRASPPRPGSPPPPASSTPPAPAARRSRQSPPPPPATPPAPSTPTPSAPRSRSRRRSGGRPRRLGRGPWPWRRGAAPGVRGAAARRSLSRRSAGGDRARAHFLAVAEDADGAVHLARARPTRRERGERDAALAAGERAPAPAAARSLDDSMAALARLRQGEDRPAAAAAAIAAIDHRLAPLGDARRRAVGPARAPSQLSLARAEPRRRRPRRRAPPRPHRLAEPTAPLLAAAPPTACSPSPARRPTPGPGSTPSSPPRPALRREQPAPGPPPRALARGRAPASWRRRRRRDRSAAAALAPSGRRWRARAAAARRAIAERTGDVGERARALSSLAGAAAPPTPPPPITPRGGARLARCRAGPAPPAPPPTPCATGAPPVAALPADAPAEAVARRPRPPGRGGARRQQQLADVREAYAALLAGEPAHVDVPTAQLRLAVALEKNGELDRAIELVAAAAPALVGYPKGQAYRRLAELHEKKGEPEAAATALEAYAAAEDIGTSTAARADAFYRAGELFRRRVGQGDAAVRCLEAALVLVPDHLPALDALELLARDLGDLDRVATILGRKIAASARQPSRQKALLCRLAALQEQLLRPDVARVTLLRALELDPDYRPALRALADLARGRGDRDELADVLARLAAPGPDDGDSGRERITAAIELATLVATDPELGPWRERALALCEALAEGAGAGHGALAEAAARLRAEVPAEPTVSGAARAEAEVARAAGDLARARAVLEEAAAGNDPRVWRELADVCAEQEDWAGCARALAALALALADTERPLFGHRRAEILLELADIYYDRVGDVGLARAAMRAAADAHGPSARRDSTLRILAAEAASNDDHTEAAAALAEIASERRTAADVLALAVAWQRAGFDQRAIASLEEVQRAGRLSDEAAMLLFALYQERRRKLDLAQALERNALGVPAPEARARLTDALGLYRDAPRRRGGGRETDRGGAGQPRPGDPAPPPAPPLAPTRHAARRAPRPRSSGWPRSLPPPATASGRGRPLRRRAIAARVRAAAIVPAPARGHREGSAPPPAPPGTPTPWSAPCSRSPPGRRGQLAVELYREAAVTARADLDDEAVVIDALGRAQLLAPGDGELVLALADALEAAGDFARLAATTTRAAPRRRRRSIARAGCWRCRSCAATAAGRSAPRPRPPRRRPRRRARAGCGVAALADARMADDDAAGARARAVPSAPPTPPPLAASARSWAAERLAARLDRDPDVARPAEVREAISRGSCSPAGGRPTAAGRGCAAGAVEAPKKDTLRGVTALVHFAGRSSPATTTAARADGASPRPA
ncbi:MAG: tetratricopeptide repeat protein [Kofleriaceae bacterium]|nr:tetratricopeptide repeat protein [Kofleriaceae bacterium]